MAPPGLLEATAWAREMHAGQKDLGGADYIDHPIRVSMSPRLESPEERIAAVLHDIVEDTPVTLAEVTARFGPRVGELVDLLTRRKPEGENHRTYLLRLSIDPAAVRIKLAD